MIPDEAKPMDLTTDEAEGPLVTPGFNPLADFANFGDSEALMLRYLGSDLGVFTKAMADAVSGYITLYWGARLVVQFTYFDRRDAPKGPLFVVGEAALVGLFLLLSMVYGALALRAFGILER